MAAAHKPQEHIEYHKDGSVWARGQTVDGVATGYWEWFRKDGTKMRSGHFDAGRQVGEWTTYDQAGAVYKLTRMKAGALMHLPMRRRAATHEGRVALLACVLGLPCGAAQAESLRCAGGIVAEGDSRLSLIYKCGQPQLADSFCAPVFYGSWPSPVPEPFASTVLPCQLTEQWLYERGQGNLVATVTLRAGKVQSISYGRTPQ